MILELRVTLDVIVWLVDCVELGVFDCVCVHAWLVVISWLADDDCDLVIDAV